MVNEVLLALSFKWNKEIVLMCLNEAVIGSVTELNDVSTLYSFRNNQTRHDKFWPQRTTGVIIKWFKNSILTKFWYILLCDNLNSQNNSMFYLNFTQKYDIYVYGN